MGVPFNTKQIEKNTWLANQAADPKQNVKLWADKSTATSKDLEKALSKTAVGIKTIFEKRLKAFHGFENDKYKTGALQANLSKDTSKGGLFVRDNKARAFFQLIGLESRKTIDLRNFASSAVDIANKQLGIELKKSPQVDNQLDEMQEVSLDDQPKEVSLSEALLQLTKQTETLNKQADIANKVFMEKTGGWSDPIK